MFEKYVINEKGFRNVTKDKEKIGFEVQLRIPYYRGIPMSCVEELTLTIDGDEIDKAHMEITVQGESFKYDEIKTAINHRWEMTDSITIFVDYPNGLSSGEHDIEAFVSLRISYQPHNNVGADKKTLVISE